MRDGKKAVPAAAKKVLWALFSFALSLSEARSGVYPFGLAACCGAFAEGPSVFLGVLAASLLGGEPGYLRAAAAMVVYAARRLAAKKGKRFGAVGAGAAAVAVTGAIAVREFAVGNVLFSSATRAACTLAILPLFAVLFAFYTPFAGPLMPRTTHFKRQIALLAWAFCAVRAVALIDIGTFMPSLAIGMFCALAAGRESPFFGGMCGFAAGLAAGPVYIPVMCIAGLAYGVFCADLKWFALVFATLTSLSSGVYLASLEGAFPEFFNLVAGAAAFGMLCRRLPAPARETKPRSANSAELKKMSAAFAAISEVFYTGPDKPVTGAELCAEIKPALFDRCAKCRFYGACRIDKYDYVNHLTDLAMRGESLPRHIGEQCPQAAAMARTALGAAARKRDEAAKASGEKAESYLSFARILSSAGEKAERDRSADPALTARAGEALSALGLRFGSVAVRGSRAIEFAAKGVIFEKSAVTPQQLSGAVARALGVKMSAPQLEKAASGWDVRMSALPGIRIEYGKAASCKTGESVSGDTAIAFESEDRRFYSLLADGMGSGENAASASRLAALFMEKLILAGGDKKEALAMLNRMLLSRRDEVYTTVDLLEIDRISGEASIIKAGAAPSYLFRTGKCWRIATDTPPAGVLDGMRVTQTAIKFRRGDVLVMLSDGACPDHGALPAPAEKRSASAYASAILESQRGRIAADDMSVCVIKAV